ncbi:MAG: hypothetical protein RLZZ435_1424 [Cyanobacteriota bacterium]
MSWKRAVLRAARFRLKLFAQFTESAIGLRESA